MEVVGDILAITTGNDSGEIWLSGLAGGVHAYRPYGNLVKISRVSVPILYMCTGFDGIRWAVGTDGLYRSDGRRWELALTENQLPAGSVLRTAAQTSPDSVWLGTSTGLVRFDFVKGVVTVPKENAFHRPVDALAYDRANDLLWSGTAAGLFGLRPEEDGWEMSDSLTFTVAGSGLASDRIVSLATDSNDPDKCILWIGTSCGLSRFKYQMNKRNE